jgi:hypothetical protein
MLIPDIGRLSCFESVVSYCGIGTRALETSATEFGILNIKYIKYIE